MTRATILERTEFLLPRLLAQASSNQNEGDSFTLTYNPKGCKQYESDCGMPPQPQPLKLNTDTDNNQMFVLKCLSLDDFT